uniref:Uncharacterized protein n=1 Tax=Syphacia muris TaxID=451379 RepID=A0A0N5AZJ9_9BILA
MFQNNNENAENVSLLKATPNFLEIQSNPENQQNTEDSKRCGRQKVFYSLRMCYVVLCLLDGIYWAYMLRDDSESSPNVWKFYSKMGKQEHYYLILRVFLDAIVGFLGMGATFWTKKSTFALPCAFVQPILISSRVFAWIFKNELPDDYRLEDFLYVILEFVLPILWFLLSVATTRTLWNEKEKRRQMRQTPLIVVSSSRTDNEESVQFEINP